MSRLPHFHPDDLDADQRALYDAITAGPRGAAVTDGAGRLIGPFNAMLAAPAVGDALQRVGAAVRYGTALSARVREMAILAVAGRWDSAFERHVHEPVARRAGVTETELLALRAFRVPDLTDDVERTALDLVFALLRDGDADDVTYAAAVSANGHRMVFELTTLVGYYATLALQLRVYRVAPD